jgi:hypothetical protein
VEISVERDRSDYSDFSESAEETIVEALRDLARWLYRQLEKEYEYLTSEPAVDEALTANGYTFLENGKLFH